MKSLKSNEIYHNVADLVGWGKYVLHEDFLPKQQLEESLWQLHISKNSQKIKKINPMKWDCFF